MLCCIHAFNPYLAAESIERIIEEQAFCGRMIRLLAHPLPLLTLQHVVSLSHSSCVSTVEVNGKGEGVGWARSQIILHRESLTLYKSFNILCLYASLIKFERMYVNRNKGASKTGSGEA
jgi:hypothetical protein